jgi:regulator of replication initiation timing
MQRGWDKTLVGQVPDEDTKTFPTLALPQSEEGSGLLEQNLELQDELALLKREMGGLAEENIRLAQENERLVRESRKQVRAVGMLLDALAELIAARPRDTNAVETRGEGFDELLREVDAAWRKR